MAETFWFDIHFRFFDILTNNLLLCLEIKSYILDLTEEVACFRVWLFVMEMFLSSYIPWVKFRKYFEMRQDQKMHFKVRSLLEFFFQVVTESY